MRGASQPARLGSRARKSRGVSRRRLGDLPGPLATLSLPRFTKVHPARPGASASRADPAPSRHSISSPSRPALRRIAAHHRDGYRSRSACCLRALPSTESRGMYAQQRRCCRFLVVPKVFPLPVVQESRHLPASRETNITVLRDTAKAAALLSSNFGPECWPTFAVLREGVNDAVNRRLYSMIASLVLIEAAPHSPQRRSWTPLKWSKPEFQTTLPSPNRETTIIRSISTLRQDGTAQEARRQRERNQGHD